MIPAADPGKGLLIFESPPLKDGQIARLEIVPTSFPIYKNHGFPLQMKCYSIRQQFFAVGTKSLQL